MATITGLSKWKRLIAGLVTGLALLGVVAFLMFTLFTGDSQPGTTQPCEIRTDYNCSDFQTWRESWEVFREAGGPEQDQYRLDGDRDGDPCEGLKR